MTATSATASAGPTIPPRRGSIAAVTDVLPESAYAAVAGAGDFAAWMAAAGRFFAGAPAVPAIAAVSTVEGGARALFRGPGAPREGVRLPADDALLAFLRHPADVALPLDRGRTLDLLHLLRALAEVGRLDAAPPLPTLAGAVRVRDPGGEVTSILFWWTAAREGRWLDALHPRLARCAPLLAQALARLGQAEAQARSTRAALLALDRALDRRDGHEGGHGDRVGRLAEVVARILADPAYERPGAHPPRLREVGRFHDIGKLHLDPALLERRGPLGAADRLAVRRHPLLARDLLAASERTAALIPGVESHHERWDGSGYPHGLAGPAIPLDARIVAVCDAFDAMVHRQPWRPARPAAEALAELQAGAGQRDDPQVVAAFAAAFEAGLVDACFAGHARDAGRVDAEVRHAQAGLARPGATAEARRALLLHLAHGRAYVGAVDEAEAALSEAEACAPGDPEVALARARLLHDLRRGDAARAAAEEALARAEGARSLEVRADALLLLGNLDRVSGRADAAVGRLLEARRLLAILDDAEREGQVLDTLGNVHLWSGDLDTARGLFRRGELLKIRVGDHHGRAINLGNQARLCFFEGRLDESRRLFEQNLALARALDDARGVLVALNGLGVVHLCLDDVGAARACFVEAAGSAESNAWGAFYAHDGLVQVAVRAGDEAAARAELAAVATLVDELGAAQPRAVLALLAALADLRFGGAGGDRLASAYAALRACGDATRYEQMLALAWLARLPEGAPLAAEIAARRTERLGWLIDGALATLPETPCPPPTP